MKKRVLITGASGFAGGFLSEHLLSLKKYDIYGTYHNDESFIQSPVKKNINFRKVDLLQSQEVLQAVKSIKPDFIVHLAASTFPAGSFKKPLETFHTNVDAEIHLLESVRAENLTKTKILITASSEIYGYVKKEELPVDEETPLRPPSPYSVSKIAQDFLGFQYNLSYKLPIIRMRPFNHIGPRQNSRFIVSDFSKQIAEIEKGKKDPVMYVGNLEAKRDYTDVRDMVRAYTMLMEKGKDGEVYNIGSGSSHSAREVLDKLLSLSTKKISVTIDPAKMRPSDIPDIICDNRKIMKDTSWEPQIPFEQTLKDTLDYWRSLG